MNAAQLDVVVAEMDRFLSRAEAARRHLDGAHKYYSSKDVAALRRASLDLTNELAKLRRSQR